MFRPIAALVAAFAIAGFVAANGSAAEEKILGIGDAAPALSIANVVKGEKIEKFEPGKIYVVEFWATWCVPCKRNIPHLTELANKYKDQNVKVIGVNIWEHDAEQVKPFMEEMGDKMDYTVALDKIPAGKTEMEGVMATTWMKAAEQTSIPAAFIVHDGKIQWIGNPSPAFDEALAQVVAGTWEPTEAAKTRLLQALFVRNLNAFNDKLRKFTEVKDYEGAVKLIDDEMARDERLAGILILSKCTLLRQMGETDRALEIAEKLEKEMWSDARNAGMLRMLAAGFLSPTNDGTVDPRMKKLALKFATRAVELSDGKIASWLDTLADAQFANGDTAGAIQSEETALQILRANTEASPALLKRMIKEFEERLEKFKAVAAEKKAAN